MTRKNPSTATDRIYEEEATSLFPSSGSRTPRKHVTIKEVIKPCDYTVESQRSSGQSTVAISKQVVEMSETKKDLVKATKTEQGNNVKAVAAIKRNFRKRFEEST